MNGCAGVPELVDGAQPYFRCAPAPVTAVKGIQRPLQPAAPSPFVPSGMGLTGALPARLQKPLLELVAPIAFEAAIAALAL